ncbi:MAG: hypothetical protein NTY07_21085, partial [Bacteroidia bacterium]|nr:hypothetical protein [Bacteroidia bacterium]
SGRNFAASFLQIPPRNGHPCSWLMVGYTTYPHNGLAPSSYSPCTAHKKKGPVPNRSLLNSNKLNC